MYSSSVFLILSALAGHVLAQPGPANTNPNCVVFSENRGTIYLSPSSIDDIGIYIRGVDCDTGSYVQVQLATSSGTVLGECGYYDLSGSIKLVSCPGFPRGTIPAGSYTFLFYPGANSGFFRPFAVTHTQETVEAPTPTVTVTETPTTTTTSTITITPTETATSAQITVTSPSTTYTNTITSTPHYAKATTTKTATRTEIKKKYLKTTKQVTSTAPCSHPTLSPCAKNNGKRTVPVASEPQAGRLQRRVPNNGEGLAPDGALTTTTTPAVVLTTSTALTITTTTTTSTTGTTATTTVPPNPLTTTLFSGSACVLTTTTLPTPTRTCTKVEHKAITSTREVTITVTKKTTKTPVCRPR